MGGKQRWAYLGRPDFNPPGTDCPTCAVPSKTWYVGGRHVDDPGGGPGHSEHRYTCEHGHEWIVSDRPRIPPDPGSDPPRVSPDPASGRADPPEGGG